MKKKIFPILLLFALMITSCNKNFDKNNNVYLVSREEGSGTKSAFSAMLGIDEVSKKAQITSSTAVMMTSVKNNKYAIGYMSQSIVGDDVKMVKIDDVMPTIDNIKNSKYDLYRTFHIVTSKELTLQSQDFLNFVTSKSGQKVIEDNGFISIENDKEYVKTKDLKGKVLISGSSSVHFVMEKLREEYQKLNKDIIIEIMQTDSSTGILSVINKTADIGMSSRNLSTGEEKKVSNTPIAIDVIALIVNKENPIDNLSKQQIKKMFEADEIKWNEI